MRRGLVLCPGAEPGLVPCPNYAYIKRSKYMCKPCQEAADRVGLRHGATGYSGEAATDRGGVRDDATGPGQPAGLSTDPVGVQPSRPSVSSTDPSLPPVRVMQEYIGNGLSIPRPNSHGSGMSTPWSFSSKPSQASGNNTPPTNNRARHVFGGTTGPRASGFGASPGSRAGDLADLDCRD